MKSIHFPVIPDADFRDHFRILVSSAQSGLSTQRLKMHMVFRNIIRRDLIVRGDLHRLDGFL